MSTDLIETLRHHRLWLDGEPEGSRAVLTHADLTHADLTDANLTGANLTNANLTYANLRGANLRGANLTNANLTYANLTNTNLTYAVLTDANLRGASLRGANLTVANLTVANLTNAILPAGWSKWNVSVQGDRIHIGCQARTRTEWDAFFADDSAETLDTPRDSAEWRRIRAAYRAACTWLDNGGLDGLHVGEGASNG